MAKIAIVAAVVSAALLTPAIGAGLDFKGIPLGASLQEVKRLAKVTCYKKNALIFDSKCEYSDPREWSFSGIPGSSISMMFIADRLDSVWINVYGDVHDRVVQAISAKVGSKPSCEPGLRGICRWNVGPDLITAQTFAESISVRYESGDGIGERDRRWSVKRSQETRQAAKDL